MRNLRQILASREKLKEEAPLIHAITNPIAINMVANAILALGAKAICASHPDEVEEIVSLSKALSLNLGNITDERMVAIDKAALAARDKKIPVIIDLVGVGASTLRYEFAKNLLETYKFAIIKGNSSEIRALALGKSKAKGIDVGDEDKITDYNFNQIARQARKLCQKYQTKVLITGVKDLIISEDSYIIASNGVENLSKITGTGCMLTAIISSFMAVTSPVEAGLLGLLLMGVSGELANTDRLYTFFVNLMDEIATIKDEDILERARVKEVKF